MNSKQFQQEQEQQQHDQKEDYISLVMHHQHPWSELEMTREPFTHKVNKQFIEKYFSQCYEETYDLTNIEIKEWWELRIECFYLYDSKVENCVKRIKGLWYMLTDTDCLEIKNKRWMDFGFQQQDPTTDFRGGGVQSLDDIINFVTEYRDYVLKEMCDPKYDFYFAISSINITFFMKKYFHLQEKLDNRDRLEIANRIALKNFCRLLVKEDDFWQKLHKLILMDLFQCWIKLKVQNPQTTINDFGTAINSVKMKVRLCKLVEHQTECVNFINLHPKATQRLACGLCYFESKDKEEYIKISEFPSLINKLLGTYSKYEVAINVSQSKFKKMIEQYEISIQNLKSYVVNQQQKIRSEFNNKQQKLTTITQSQPHLLTEDDIQFYYQQQKENSQFQIKINQDIYDFDQLLQILENQIDIIDQIISPMTSITEFETKLVQQYQLNDFISKQMNQQLIDFKDINQNPEEQFKIIQNNQNQQYIGSSNNNQPDGFGSLIDSQNNTYYKGIWDKGQFRYGLKVDLSNQQLFKGNFELSELNKYEINGDGYYINQAGDIYQGYFENDIFNYQGTMKYANQSFYQGQWLAGKYMGEGHYEDQNRKYHGEFSNGLFEGYGTLEDLQTKSIYKGRFRNGKYNGKGTLILQDPKVKYKGMFENNQLHGYAQEIIQIDQKQQQEDQGNEIDITKSLYRSLTKKSIIDNQPKKIKQITEGEYVNGLKNEIHNQYIIINKIKQKKILNLFYCQGEQIYVEENL